MSSGRFAPSPSGDLHIGNLRTALLAWLCARRTGRDFVIRVEDLDRVREGAEARQLADLAAIGLDWDGPVVRQSERARFYDAALASLAGRGLVFECFCTRREILEAPSAPHAPPGSYPGTCRDLTEAEREARRQDRPAALRLRSDVATFTVQDALHGTYEGVVDDFVLRRGDGAVAYNLAVVVDDAQQGIDQVVRGDDLLSSAPRQAYLASLLGSTPPSYVHVPLALNTEGKRLAKRDGAVTLAELGPQTFGLIVASLGMHGSSPRELLETFEIEQIPRDPWIFVPPA
ncbi:tRNA glutamyl-Q(34) synthetase GluQRS [Aeromicrobium wangtongii]|uniref:Glutamyl-Q tRNA(Asp) synthetase n=1 Tax=Aeromicrobium wangtongii TaxID=2969247 RepID=A0ABY5M7D1_9ACTN|nr:tRNA glutamyl-Q(34) synthetase GluQRS [Aeromicrobium wangtongii]MCD9199726.1 tRNA glutamyl-Q(34) synthetase GluQRS [Aeromicrobium wangtongii]UUP14075.1 tRNA glutamyl-Q(34) synthetase GluQRS [Aeromicrobium wangtongii]